MCSRVFCAAPKTPRWVLTAAIAVIDGVDVRGVGAPRRRAVRTTVEGLAVVGADLERRRRLAAEQAVPLNVVLVPMSDDRG